MALELLFAQFTLFDLLLAPAVDYVSALEVHLVAVLDEGILALLALFLALSAALIRIICLIYALDVHDGLSSRSFSFLAVFLLPRTLAILIDL